MFESTDNYIIWITSETKLLVSNCYHFQCPPWPTNCRIVSVFICLTIWMLNVYCITNKTCQSVHMYNQLSIFGVFICLVIEAFLVSLFASPIKHYSCLHVPSRFVIFRVFKIIRNFRCLHMPGQNTCLVSSLA